MALYESEVTKREGVGGGRGLVGVACASVADKGVDDGEEHGARGFIERGDGVDAVAADGQRGREIEVDAFAFQNLDEWTILVMAGPGGHSASANVSAPRRTRPRRPTDSPGRRSGRA